MQRLWAPWRMEYILSDKDEAKRCIFCEAREIRDQAVLSKKLILKKFDHCLVIMNLFPYNNGHLMVVPYLHCASLEELPTEVSAQLTTVMSKSVEVLKQVLSPEGFNLGMNLGRTAGAGIDTHLHWHIVPRWNGDTNFMPVLSETKVMSQHLDDSYHQLKPFFDKIVL